MRKRISFFSAVGALCAVLATLFLPLSAVAAGISLSNVVVTTLGPNLYETQIRAMLQMDSAALPPGTHISLFDVYDLIPGSASFTAVGWTVTTPLLGQAAVGQSPPDSPTVQNIVSVYTGAPLTSPQILGYLRFQSSSPPGGTAVYNTQSLQLSNELWASVSGDLQGMPNAVPELPTMAIVLTGVAGISAGAARRKKQKK